MVVTWVSHCIVFHESGTNWKRYLLIGAHSLYAFTLLPSIMVNGSSPETLSLECNFFVETTQKVEIDFCQNAGKRENVQKSSPLYFILNWGNRIFILTVSTTLMANLIDK